MTYFWRNSNLCLHINYILNQIYCNVFLALLYKRLMKSIPLKISNRLHFQEKDYYFAVNFYIIFLYVKVICEFQYWLGNIWPTSVFWVSFVLLRIRITSDKHLTAIKTLKTVLAISRFIESRKVETRKKKYKLETSLLCITN